MPAATFTTISNPNIKIKANKLVVDRAISKRIPSPLPGSKSDPKAFCWVLSAPPGSGKSTALYSMLCEKGKGARCYYKTFHHVFMIMPKESVRSLPEKHPLRSHPDEKFYNDFDLETLEEIAELVEEAAERGERSCIVCDDVGSRLKQNRALEKYFSFLVQTRRHRMLSFFITLQNWNDMPLSTRKNVSHVSFWKPLNQKETLNVWSEIINVEKDNLQALFDFVYTAKHNFLFCALYTGKIYKNFQEIKISVNTNSNGHKTKSDAEDRDRAKQDEGKIKASEASKDQEAHQGKT